MYSPYMYAWAPGSCLLKQGFRYMKACYIKVLFHTFYCTVIFAKLENTCTCTCVVGYTCIKDFVI